MQFILLRSVMKFCYLLIINLFLIIDTHITCIRVKNKDKGLAKMHLTKLSKLNIETQTMT